MNELALFAGSGLGLVGSRLLNHKVICAVEQDPFCQQILMARQEDGSLPPFPIWDDARTFKGKDWRGLVDVISAGFPCQPYAVCGQQKGIHDERNLWPDTARIISEGRPRVVLLENVPPVIQHMGAILTGDLARMGYSARYGVISAKEANAPHLRKRWWCVAHANSEHSAK